MNPLSLALGWLLDFDTCVRVPFAAGDAPNQDNASGTRKVCDTPCVFSASEAPPGVIIPPHCEQSYCNVRCRYIAFYCEVAALHGGETPIVDMQAAYASLPRRLRDYLDGAVIEVGGKRRTYAPASWTMCLGASHESEARANCERQGMQVLKAASGSLQVRGETPAVVVHPQTQQRCLTINNDVTQFYWWNVLGPFLPCSRSWSARLLRRLLVPLFVRLPVVERFAAASLRAFLKRTIGETELSSTQIKRGVTPITHADRVMINDALRRHSTLFRWQAGDILILDNIRAGHARLDFKGPRKTWTMMCSTYDARTVRAQDL